MHTPTFGVCLLLSITSVCYTLFCECASIPKTFKIISRLMPKSAKVCSMSVHRSVQEFEFYPIRSRLIQKSYKRRIFRVTIVVCPSNAHPELWCLHDSLHHLCLHNFDPWMCIDPFKSLNFTAYSALMQKSYTRGILGRAVVGCPSDAHPNFGIYLLRSITFVR